MRFPSGVALRRMFQHGIHFVWESLAVEVSSVSSMTVSSGSWSSFDSVIWRPVAVLIEIPDEAIFLTPFSLLYFPLVGGFDRDHCCIGKHTNAK